MSLRDECECPFPGAAAANAGLLWTCPGCGARYEYEGGGDWRGGFGGTPAPEWSGRIRDLEDDALRGLADAIKREWARRSA